MKNTIIFDMDGVIVDSEPVHKYAFYQHFEQLNISIPEEEYTTFTGLSTQNVYQYLKDKYHLKQEVSDLVHQKRDIFNKAFDEKKDLDLLPGVGKLIQDLYQDGFQLILASSSAKVTINRVFTRFKLHQFFTHIVSGEDFPKSKPDPAIFLKAAEISNHKKEECIVIEDSTNGIEAAVRAGIFCVGYVSENSKFQNLEKANMIIHHFAELNPQKLRNLK